MKKKTILAGILSALLLLAFTGAVIAAPLPAKPAKKPFVPTDPILPIAQVKPGMKGTCYTVIRGTEVVSFPVEVVDILPRGGTPNNLILIKASGKVIEETGGIAAGMSGSPVYIGRRLVGAIGYGWNFSRHDLGLVTPIEDMAQVWNNPEKIPTFDPAPIIPDAPPKAASADQKREVGSGDRDGKDEHASPDVVTVRKAFSEEPLTGFASPVVVQGVSPRMAELLAERLGCDVNTMGGSAIGERSKKARYDARMEPGMAVGAALLWGDVEISAIGTLTAVDGDGRFVAFAHPFMNLGPTAAALMDARIARVIPGVASPFKLGTTGDIIGIVTQDRPEGIGGRIGRFAPAASCTVNLDDVDSGRSYQRRFQMVQDPYNISTLTSPAITGLVENLWGRRGGGSVKITTQFAGNALPKGWKRSNIFVSDKDVIAEMMKEFDLLTKMFALNQFQELRPFGMEVAVEITQEPRVLYVEDVVVPKGPFRPGETVSFDITLRPWRKAPFTRSYSLTIPENVVGICELLVRGGGIAEERPEYMDAGWRTISSLPILLKELDATETNDQIVLEIRGQEALEKQIKRAQSGNPEDLMNDKLKSEIRAEKEKEGSIRFVRTNYYVDGLIHRLINVDPTAAAKGEGESEK